MEIMQTKTLTFRLLRWWLRLTVAGSVIILCSCQQLSVRRPPPSPALPLGSAWNHEAAPRQKAPPSSSTSSAAVWDGWLRSQKTDEPSSPEEHIPYQGPLWASSARQEAHKAVPAAFEAPLVESEPREPTLRIEPAPNIPRESLVSPFQPPGARRPWPTDEYVRDGADEPPKVLVTEYWRLTGMNAGDTVVHYETQSGRRVVEPTNPVYVYSPRFGAVRQVLSFSSEEQFEFAAGTAGSTAIQQSQRHFAPLSSKQHYQLQEQTADRRVNQLASQQGDGTVSGTMGLRAVHDGFLPYENLSVLRTGKLEAHEFVLVAQAAEAARGWSHAAVVQVFIDSKAAVALPGVTAVDVFYGVEEPPTFPKLRVIKLASRGHAAPGELIQFVIRFDNVGTEPLKNVTVVDSLTARLEFINGTADCSLPSEFSVEENQAGSSVLRWHLTEPLAPGEGGVIRFHCRVR